MDMDRIPVQHSEAPCHGLCSSTSSNPPISFADTTEYSLLGRKQDTTGLGSTGLLGGEGWSNPWAEVERDISSSNRLISDLL
jgi:hypothetical protein